MSFREDFVNTLRRYGKLPPTSLGEIEELMQQLLAAYEENKQLKQNQALIIEI